MASNVCLFMVGARSRADVEMTGDELGDNKQHRHSETMPTMWRSDQRGFP